MAVELEPVVPSESAETHGIVGAATILALGSISSRVLGLGRELVIADLFGATGYVSVMRVASTLVLTLYDFLVGGLVTAALVPVLSEYADRKAEFWRLAGMVLSVMTVLLALAVLLLELLAEPLFTLLGAGYEPNLRAAGVDLVRLSLPAVFFLGMAGVLSSILYSRKQFVLPSFTTAAFNLAIIVCAILLAPFLGITSVVVGLVVGAALQVLLQLTGLGRGVVRFSFDFSHPALRQIVRLYVPVLGGLSVMLVGVAIDRNLASHTGDQSLAWMQAATYLVQLPLGLVTTAISFAILPTLSRAVEPSEFRHTLAFGLKLVLILILPCIVALYVLAGPVVTLVYEHGAFTARDTVQTSQSLQLYLLGTAFAAIDMPLVFAFYARKNTLLPNLVAVAALAIYLAVALTLVGPLGYQALVLANSAQLTGHALIMLALAQSRLGGLGGEQLCLTTLKLLIASAVMGGALALVPGFLPALTSGAPSASLAGKLLAVVLPSLAGVLVYLAALRLLKVRELEQIRFLVRARLGRCPSRAA